MPSYRKPPRGRWRRFVTIVTLLAMAALPHARAEDARAPGSSYVFGVFPYLLPLELEKIFAPIAADFARVLDRDVQFASKTSYEVFARNLADQTYDIAFVQPFDYVRAADRSGYLPLAARREKLYALLVTTTDSTIKAVADLKGQRIGLPPRDAAISHLVRAFLRKSGLNPEKDVVLSYYRSHSSCLHQVIIQAVDACGTTPSAMHQLRDAMSAKLRAIAETEPIPPALFAVHSRVPAAERQRILAAIMAWSQEPAPRDIRLSGFFPITDADYDVVRNFPAE